MPTHRVQLLAIMSRHGLRYENISNELMDAMQQLDEEGDVEICRWVQLGGWVAALVPYIWCKVVDGWLGSCPCVHIHPLNWNHNALMSMY